MALVDFDSLDLGFDIVIIGAGAAGCSLADNLSGKYKVLLVDSKDFPRKKACSGIIVSEGMEFFDGKINESVMLSPNFLDISYVDVDNDLEKKVEKGFVNSSRFELDKLLLDKIVDKENIFFIKNTMFVEFIDTSDGVHTVVVLESNGRIKTIITKYLVGCDGAISRIRKKISKKDVKFYVGIQEVIKCDAKIDRAFFIFDSSITDFYSWVIPKGELVEIGTLLPPIESKEKYGAFKEKICKKFGVRGDGLVNSAIVLRPQSRQDICLGKGGIFLCGEAAGLISPSSAEGISFALWSGKYCAEALNDDKHPMKGYEKRCAVLLERLEKKFTKSFLISDKEKRKELFG